MRAVLRGTRAALLSQFDRAIARLRHRSHTERAVHEIRKELKRARAALRLLRGCLGAADYRWENLLMRDAVRPLAPVRDARVLLEAFRRWTRDEVAERDAPGIARLEVVLQEEQRAAQRQLSPTDLDHAAEVLSAIRRRAAALTSRQLAQTSLGDALKRIYKSGRKSFVRAQRRSTNDRLHQWRKHTKYFANQLEFILPFDPRKGFAKSHKGAHRLADWLGEDHDLALLTKRIAQHAAPGNAAASELENLTARLRRRRRLLQRKCLNLGARLYRGKAGRYRY